MSHVISVMYLGCYNFTVRSHFRSKIMTGIGSNLSFAVIVFVTFFFIFYTHQSLSTSKMVILIVLGTLYLANGIYGYRFCLTSNHHSVSVIYLITQILIASYVLYNASFVSYNILMLLPLLIQSAVLFKGIENTIANFAITISYTLSIYFSSGMQAVWDRLAILVGAQLFIVSFVQMVINEESSRVEIEGLVKDLEVTNELLQNYAGQVEELTVLSERARIAREIHDGLGHYLTTIGMQVKAAQATLGTNPVQASGFLNTAETLTQEALDDVRESVSTMRIEAKNEVPLVQRLYRLLKPFENTGYKVKTIVKGTESQLDHEIEVLLFRVLQEGLSNIGRHSNASEIQVAIDFTDPTTVSLTVKDNGSLQQELVEGNGILGIRERIARVKGKLNIIRDQSGFLLSIEVPKKI